jgi:hypothetical protein
MHAQDMSFKPCPRFADINGNGRRDYMDSTGTIFNEGYEFPEPWYLPTDLKVDFSEIKGLKKTTWPIHKTFTKGNGGVVNYGDPIYYIDYNGNDKFDISEPLYVPGSNYIDMNSITTASLTAYRASAPYNGNYKDIDWNDDGKPQPSESGNAIIMKEKMYTKDGGVVNNLTYMQVDARRLCIEVWAEVKGVKSEVRRYAPLPIGKNDVQDWNPFDGKGNLW